MVSRSTLIISNLYLRIQYQDSIDACWTGRSILLLSQHSRQPRQAACCLPELHFMHNDLRSISLLLGILTMHNSHTTCATYTLHCVAHLGTIQPFQGFFALHAQCVKECAVCQRMLQKIRHECNQSCMTCKFCKAGFCHNSGDKMDCSNIKLKCMMCFRC